MKGYLYTPRGYDGRTVYSTFDAAVEAMLKDEGFKTLTEFIESVEEDAIDYAIELTETSLYIDDGPYIDEVELRLSHV